MAVRRKLCFQKIDAVPGARSRSWMRTAASWLHLGESLLRISYISRACTSKSRSESPANPPSLLGCTPRGILFSCSQTMLAPQYRALSGISLSEYLVIPGVLTFVNVHTSREQPLSPRTIDAFIPDDLELSLLRVGLLPPLQPAARPVCASLVRCYSWMLRSRPCESGLPPPELRSIETHITGVTLVGLGQQSSNGGTMRYWRRFYRAS